MKPWIILASGPSQCQADIDAVRGQGIVVAINNQVFAAPWADILYSCDSSWWRHYRDQCVGFAGERLSIDPLAAEFGATVLPTERGKGLGRTAIRTGHNSGYQAINLAFLRGARTIVLLGFDMQHTDGRIHNHADHPRPLGNFCPGMPELCRPQFGALAADLRGEGVRVINATRKTALTCFERMPLSEALRQPHPA